jgi:protoporphyrinogen oxidase
MPTPHVVILGAGPAGLGAAYRLSQRGDVRITVLERGAVVGGNAGSFELAGQWVDYGSHRLHPAADPALLADIRGLLGDDLLDRPRHGRIRLQGRWLQFPLKPFDLFTHLPPAFALGAASDAARRTWRGKARLARQGAAQADSTFADVLEAGLGKTICREFYFPYARKLWGLPPDQLAGEQAVRRVSAGSPGKMLRKVLSAVPGLKPRGAGRFFYPRRGFGQISAAYYTASQAAGVTFCFNANVQGMTMECGSSASAAEAELPHSKRDDPRSIVVRYAVGGQPVSLAADHVWSTIPVTALARLLDPPPPADLLAATAQLGFRAMILIYLVLETPQFTEYDAHYFPEPGVAISRLSEPKNYAGLREPVDTTVLCAELPCADGDAVWQMTDDELGRLVCDNLATCGLPVRVPVRQVVTRRLRQAYPIYRVGYAEAFTRLDRWLGEIDGLLTLGRQGLFVHDNTHHALYMGYCAADCLTGDGSFDRARWRGYRGEFERHVVED